jgi:hypothetical protein
VEADLPVESWQDAKIVTEIAGKAANWASESQGPAVQVLFAGSTGAPGVRDVESVDAGEVE